MNESKGGGGNGHINGQNIGISPMNEYIQEKIKQICFELDISNGESKRLETELVLLVKDAYTRGVQDSLKCVPEEIEVSFIGDRHFQIENIVWNDCRQQTIDNISKLLTNK